MSCGLAGNANPLFLSLSSIVFLPLKLQLSLSPTLSSFSFLFSFPSLFTSLLGKRENNPSSSPFFSSFLFFSFSLPKPVSLSLSFSCFTQVQGATCSLFCSHGQQQSYCSPSLSLSLFLTLTLHSILLTHGLLLHIAAHDPLPHSLTHIALSLSLSPTFAYLILVPSLSLSLSFTHASHSLSHA